MYFEKNTRTFLPLCSSGPVQMGMKGYSYTEKVVVWQYCAKVNTNQKIGEKIL